MREEKRYHVYIMSSRSLTLYTGVTGNIYQRTLQHKAGEIGGFTKKYHINRLVYYETFKYVNSALAREKQLKAWTRAKRLALIKTMNPAWQDLAEGWGEPMKLQIPHFVRDDNFDRGTDGIEDLERVDKGPERVDSPRGKQGPREKTGTERVGKGPDGANKL
jgi:putative endonuclease